MTALDFDAKEYSKFIVDMSGTPYMMVAGRLMLAHKSGQLIGLSTEKIYEDENVIQVVAVVRVFNPTTFAKLIELGVSPDVALSLASQYFSGMAESDKLAVNNKGDKTAESKRPLEVAETSAVGRALGMGGFGPLESVASADEIFTLLSNERKGGASSFSGGATLSEGQSKFLKDLIAQKLGKTVDEAAQDKFNKNFEDVNKREGSSWIEELKAMSNAAGASAPRRRTTKATPEAPDFS